MLKTRNLPSILKWLMDKQLVLHSPEAILSSIAAVQSLGHV